MLKIANANEINPAKPRYNFRHHSFKRVAPIFTAPTGPVNLFNAEPIFPLLKERRFLPSDPSAPRVSLVSAHISCSHARIA
jgi:hypothetical protein